MAEQNEQAKQWAKVVAKAWADEDYKQRLMSDPTSVLTGEGMEMPEGVEIKVVEATDKQAWMVLPPRPRNSGEIEEATERVAAGCSCNVMMCTFPR